MFDEVLVEAIREAIISMRGDNRPNTINNFAKPFQENKDEH